MTKLSENEKKELETTEAVADKKPAKSDSAKKSKPVEKQKKTGRVSRYLREMKSELKKVVWPTKKQTINNTGVVILCVFIVGVFVWIFDGIASQLIRALLRLFGG